MAGRFRVVGEVKLLLFGSGFFPFLQRHTGMEFLLQTPLGARVEARLFRDKDELQVSTIGSIFAFPVKW